MSAACEGEVRRFSKGGRHEGIQVSFQGAPLDVSFMVCFNDPKFRRAIPQRLGDLSKLNSMYHFTAGNCSGCSRKIRVRGRVGIVSRCSGHGEKRKRLTGGKKGAGARMHKNIERRTYRKVRSKALETFMSGRGAKVTTAVFEPVRLYQVSETEVR